MKPTRAMLITPDVTYSGPFGGGLTPADYAANGLSGLVDRLAGKFDGEGVVLLDAKAATALDVRDWQTIEVAATLTDKTFVHVAPVSAIEGHALHAPFAMDTVGSFELFHDILGVAFHRSPGTAGLSLLQSMYPKGRTAPVVWESDQPRDASETQYFPSDWKREPDPEARYLLGYDRRRAGLAAMQTVHVARYALRHTRKRTFDPFLSGWWLCEVPPWNVAHMPDPAGYGPPGKTLRWLTTPTVQLLNDLAAEGVSQGVRFIHDSWTAPRSRLFEGWATRVDKAIATARSVATAPVDPPAWPGKASDAERVLDALSEVYRETNGMFNAPTSWTSRLDWFAAVKATERAAVWRMAWKIGQTSGRWPVRVDGDKLWYPAKTSDGEAEAPAAEARTGVPFLGMGLGQWRHEGTVRL